jgi:hypothetical protein
MGNSSRNPNTEHQARVKKEQWRREEQAVDQVQHPADPRQHVPGVLRIGAPLDDRFRQVADNRREPKQYP